MMAYYNLLNYVARPDKCNFWYYGMTNVYMNPECSPETLIDHQKVLEIAYYMAET